MIEYPINVLGSGAVLLGQEVVCDGFHSARPIRVQTDVHDNHMGDFNTSKGFQNLYMSEETHGLLVAEFDADLVVRENLYPVAMHTRQRVGDCSITLLPSRQMLGAVQVLVELSNGLRIGYSGNFHWPLEPRDVLKCDALVVDSTNGSPQSIREYSQQEAETRFLEIVESNLNRGSVHINAHRGTVQRALQLLGRNVNAPILCSERLCKEVAVYQRFVPAIGTVINCRSQDARSAITDRRYIQLYSKGDRFAVERPDGVSITLSAFMTRRDDPVLEYSQRAYGIALSNHADFLGILEYVDATGAKYVVTDNTRNHGVELAQAIGERLGVVAEPSSNFQSREWGA